jgi:hypothetical protein
MIGRGGIVSALAAFAAVSNAAASTDLDTFGIAKFHPTRAGTREWNSLHWDNTKDRTVKYAEDVHDPTGWTEDHSGGTDGFRIDGQGTMTMSGSGPRFHVNSMDSSKVPAQFFRDVEFTAWYMRKGSAGANYGGMVVGMRSGPLGHASSGGNDCDATTYYARFRNDGKWDFEKELKHPGSTYWSGSGLNTQDPLWKGAKLPLNRWIGMKYLAWDLPGRNAVHLELWIDSTSNGTPTNGGNWALVGSVVDSGQWASGDVSGCTYSAATVISPGHGTLLWRTDGDTAVYKSVSIREIDPFATTSLPTRTRKPTGTIRMRATSTGALVELDGTPVPTESVTLRGLDGHALPAMSPDRGMIVVSVRTPQGTVHALVPALLRNRSGR